MSALTTIAPIVPQLPKPRSPRATSRTSTGVSALFEPRPYQKECVSETLNRLHGRPGLSGSGLVNRVANVLATGTGKTVIFSSYVGLWVSAGLRVLVVVDSEQLLDQTIPKIASNAPGARIGVVQGERNDVGNEFDVIIAMQQTLMQPGRKEQLPPIDLMIFDECHFAVANTWLETTAYFGGYGHDGLIYTPPGSQSAKYFRCGCGGREGHQPTPVIGMTATMGRVDKRDLSTIWQEVTYEYSIADGIRDGWLVDVRGETMEVEDLNLAAVARSRGDMSDKSLGEALVAANTPELAVKFWLDRAPERSTVAFTPTVDSARKLLEAFEAAGVAAEMADGKTPKKLRKQIIGRFNSGVTRVLISCMLYTKGFDEPRASCALIMRPTENPFLYTQMVGRVLRPSPETGKTDALVLDVSGKDGSGKLVGLVELTGLDMQMDQGESVGEAIRRNKREVEEAPEPLAVRRNFGDMRITQFDLLAQQSDSVCLKSSGKGIWFVPVQDAVYFLYPRKDGTYWEGRLGAGETIADTTEEHILRKDLSLTYGFKHMAKDAEAEEERNRAEDPRRARVSKKKAGWRREAISDKQAAFMEGLRLDPTAYRNRGEASDAINLHVYSPRLDA